MKKTYLTWAELRFRADLIVEKMKKELGVESLVIWGIPTGGQVAVGAFAHRTDVEVTYEHPTIADVVIDDIYDTGDTMAHYCAKYRLPGMALVDKRNPEDKDLGWVVFPWEAAKIEEETVDDNIVRILEYIGDDPKREGLQETPKRVVKSYKTLFGGYGQDPKDHMKIFEDSCDEMVIASFEFYSMCEHHMLPFFGTAHVAYIPNGKVIGVSKLSRVFDVFARRLQIQERLGQQVCEALEAGLEPLGVACAIQAQHMCMTMRGVQKQSAMMKTSCLRGVFKSKPEARKEFFDLIR